MQFKYNDRLTIDTSDSVFGREGLRVGLFGAPGSGKSYAAGAWLIEPFLKQGGTLIIFQPVSEWHTLKKVFNAIQVIGGPWDADMPFIPAHPELYAKLVVQKGISMIFSTSEVDDEEKLVSFVEGFLKALMREQEKLHRPVMVVLEEAHEFCPRTPTGHVAPPWVFNRMVKRCKDLWTGGRKLNIVPVAISQRPQEVHFAVRQLCNVTLLGQFSSQDIKYIDKEVLEPFRRMGIEVESETLLKLDPGEFLIIEHGDADIAQMTVKRITPHGADTPKLDAVPTAPLEVVQARTALGEEIRELIEAEEAEEKENEKLKKEVSRLKGRLEEIEEKQKTQKTLREMLAEGPGKGKADAAQVSKAIEELQEKLSEKERTLKALQGEIADKQKRIETLEKNSSSVEPLLDIFRREAKKAVAQEWADGLPHMRQELLSTLSIAHDDGNGMVIQHTPTEATIRQSDPLRIVFDTTTATGRVIYALVMVLKKPSSESMIAEVMAEYAWPNSHGSVSKAISTLVGENMLVKQGSDPVLYRPASMVKFVPDKEVEKAK